MSQTILRTLHPWRWPLAVVVSVALAAWAAIEITVLALELDPATVDILQSIRTGAGGLAATAGTLLVPIVIAMLDRNGDGRITADDFRDPPGGGAGGVGAAVLGVVLLTLPACGPSELAIQADAAAMTGRIFAEADATLIRLRAAELDAVLADARAECPEDTGCPEDRREHYRARFGAVQSEWRPILACRAPFPEALRGWVDAIELGSQASDEDIAKAGAIAAAARTVLVYNGVRECVISARPATEWPALPTMVTTLAEGAAR